MPSWLRTWLIVAIVAAAALVLWFGLMLAIVLAAVIFMPLWIWILLAGKRMQRGPVTIEGEHWVRETPVLEDWDEPPERHFTGTELSTLRNAPVWVVWYQDLFGSSAQRESFGVAVCRTKEGAQAEMQRRGASLEPGGQGYEIRGPEDPLASPLLRGQRIRILRELLNRLESGSTEPIPMLIQ